MSIRILTAQDIERLLPMPDAIDAMRQAFTQLAEHQVTMPLRTAIPVPAHQAVTLCMPAYAAGIEQLGIKIVSVFPENQSLGLPAIYGFVVVLNPKTGEPQALLNGSVLTALRTGAVSGLATDLLARTDASSVAIIGSGVQARTQLEAVCCVRDIERVMVYSPHRANAERFAAEVANLIHFSNRIEVMSSPHEAAAQADIICTATSATSPVLERLDVKVGVHINAIGSHSANICELSPALMHESLVVVDQRIAALAEAGEVIQSIQQELLQENDLIELGEVLSGAHPGRTKPDQITVFKSVGLAIQDLCAAQRVVTSALSLGIGQMIEL